MSMIEPISRKGRGASRFTQADVSRAIAGAMKAGMKVGRVEIDPNGNIVILSEAMAPPVDANPWDRVFGR